MFRVRRNAAVYSTGYPFAGYDVATYGTIALIETAIGTGAVKAGDNIMGVWNRNTQSRVGYVNASNAIVYTPQ